ncbi:rhodanese-like domain-containing protein [Brumimicrobium sp.]|uniref:rhodanese-like domain-containing protein n=1 Tax=Brumimicrobium sp. TaxID=2029867 RepID=UPI00260A915F|nr:rhodanese-like domain-containing protein [uncultured Brumimicrobium sp.]
MKDLNQADWKAQIEANENAVILDVRRPDECEEGIIPNAITIDIMNPQPFLKEVEKLDKNVPYFIYCRSGARSGQACLIMEELGFEETYNLIGGILEWNGDIV